MTLPDLLGEINSTPWETSAGGPMAGSPLEASEARAPATKY